MEGEENTVNPEPEKQGNNTFMVEIKDYNMVNGMLKNTFPQ